LTKFCAECGTPQNILPTSYSEPVGEVLPEGNKPFPFEEVQTSESHWKRRVFITGVILVLTTSTAAIWSNYRSHHHAQVADTGKELLWDFVSGTHSNWSDLEIKPVNTVNVPRDTISAIQIAVDKMNPLKDPIQITASIQGSFLSDTQGVQQTLYSLVEYHPKLSRADNQSFYFAVQHDGAITVIQSSELNTALRSVRVPDSDVDYVLAVRGGSTQGEEVSFARIVSLREYLVTYQVKVIADIGYVYDSSCGQLGKQGTSIAAKVYYQPAGQAIEILPFEQYEAHCEANGSNFQFLKTSTDDSMKVSTALAQYSALGSGGSAEPKTTPEKGAAPVYFKAGAARRVKASFLGFEGWESSEDAATHARSMGFEQNGACKSRVYSGYNSGYTDCNFSNNVVESITISFYLGKLQRIDYNFGVNRYDQIRATVIMAFGNSNGSDDSAENWGGGKDGYSISLGKTVVSPIRGWVMFVLDPDIHQ
jgi:hypothetical protein